MTTPTPVPYTTLTAKQRALVDYIAAALQVEHHWPTAKQAAHDFGVTTNAIHTALRYIEKKGHITRNAHGKPMLAHHCVTVHRAAQLGLAA